MKNDGEFTRLFTAALGTAVALWLIRGAKRKKGPWFTFVPYPKPKREPKLDPGLSAVDQRRLSDDYGYEGRYRAEGQRVGIAKMLMDDPDA